MAKGAGSPPRVGSREDPPRTLRGRGPAHALIWDSGLPDLGENASRTATGLSHGARHLQGPRGEGGRLLERQCCEPPPGGATRAHKPPLSPSVLPLCASPAVWCPAGPVMSPDTLGLSFLFGQTGRITVRTQGPSGGLRLTFREHPEGTERGSVWEIHPGRRAGQVGVQAGPRPLMDQVSQPSGPRTGALRAVSGLGPGSWLDGDPGRSPGACSPRTIPILLSLRPWTIHPTKEHSK